MRILLTGASGHLGKLLVANLGNEFDFVRLGRNDGDFEWTLGVIPPPEILEGVDAIVHLAWSMKDRKADGHKNIGGSHLLAQCAGTARIPFLFISSVAVLGKSNYGNSKREAEKLIASENGSILRIGLVKNVNRYGGDIRKVQLVLKSNHKINFTLAEDFISSIRFWLEGQVKNLPTSKIYTLVSGSQTATEFFKSPTGRNIFVQEYLIWSFLKIFSLFSTTARNSLDAFQSFKSTPDIRTLKDDRNNLSDPQL